MFMIVLLPQQSMSVTDGFFWDSSEQLPYWQGAITEQLSPFPELSNENTISFTYISGMDEDECFRQYWEKKTKLDTNELGGLAVAAAVRSRAFIGW